MCNCNNTQPCGNCQNGYPCNCPPNYYVQPVATGCLCCPPNYIAKTFNGGTYCFNLLEPNDPPIPQVACNPCEETISSNCVTYNSAEGYPINYFGIVNGDSLTTMINKIYTTFQAFFVSPQFCAAVQNCPPASSGTTPLIGTLIITIP